MWAEEQDESKDTCQISPVVLFTRAICASIACTIGHVQMSKEFKTRPVRPETSGPCSAAIMWQNLRDDVKLHKKDCPAWVRGVLRKHCFTTASHTCLSHVFLSALRFLKEHREEVVPLLRGEEHTVAKLSTAPLDAYWLQMSSSCMINAPAQLSHMVQSMVVIYNEMSLPDDQRALPPTASSRLRVWPPSASLPSASATTEHQDTSDHAARATKQKKAEHDLTKHLFQKCCLRKVISVTDVTTAPGGKKFRGKQLAVAQLFDSFQAMGAGTRMGEPSEREVPNSRVHVHDRLRFEFDPQAMSTELRLNLCIGGSKQEVGGLSHQGEDYLDLGDCFLDLKNSCFALHAHASILGASHRHGHLVQCPLSQLRHELSQLATGHPLMLTVGCDVPCVLLPLHYALQQSQVCLLVNVVATLADPSLPRATLLLGDHEAHFRATPLIIGIAEGHCVMARGPLETERHKFSPPLFDADDTRQLVTILNENSSSPVVPCDIVAPAFSLQRPPSVHWEGVPQMRGGAKKKLTPLSDKQPVANKAGVSKGLDESRSDVCAIRRKVINFPKDKPANRVTAEKKDEYVEAFARVGFDDAAIARQCEIDHVSQRSAAASSSFSARSCLLGDVNQPTINVGSRQMLRQSSGATTIELDIVCGQFETFKKAGLQFHFPSADAQRSTAKIEAAHAHIEQLWPWLKPEVALCLAETLQWFFSAEYIWFSAIVTGDQQLFQDTSCSSLKPPLGPKQQWPLHMSQSIEAFRELFRATASKAIRWVHASLPHEAEPEVVYRGMTLPSCADVEAYLHQVEQCGIIDAASFTTSLPVALRFTATKSPPSSTFAFRLLKQGFKLPVVTHGLLCILDGFCPIAVTDLKQTDSEQEVWMRHEGPMSVAVFRSVHDSSHLKQMLDAPLPASHQKLTPALVSQIMNHFKSENEVLVVALITKGSPVQKTVQTPAPITSRGSPKTEHQTCSLVARVAQMRSSVQDGNARTCFEQSQADCMFQDWEQFRLKQKQWASTLVSGRTLRIHAEKRKLNQGDRFSYKLFCTTCLTCRKQLSQYRVAGEKPPSKGWHAIVGYNADSNIITREWTPVEHHGNFDFLCKRSEVTSTTESALNHHRRTRARFATPMAQEQQVALPDRSKMSPKHTVRTLSKSEQPPAKKAKSPALRCHRRSPVSCGRRSQRRRSGIDV